MGLFNQLFSKNPENELKAIVQGGAFLVDVRSPGDFQAGHVDGSVNIPLDAIQANLSRFRGKDHIVVFCQSGLRSALACSLLEKNGIKSVLNGGSWTNIERLLP